MYGCTRISKRDEKDGTYHEDMLVHFLTDARSRSAAEAEQLVAVIFVAGNRGRMVFKHMTSNSREVRTITI